MSRAIHDVIFNKYAPKLIEHYKINYAHYNSKDEHISTNTLTKAALMGSGQSQDRVRTGPGQGQDRVRTVSGLKRAPWVNLVI